MMSEHRIEGDWFEDDLAVALGRNVEVDYATVVIGCGTGIAFYVHDELSDKQFSCYYSSTAGDMCCNCDSEAYQNLSSSERAATRGWIAECYKHWRGCDPGFEFFAPDPPPCPCEQCIAKDDPEDWLIDMIGADDWSEREWESYDEVPDVY